MATRGLLLAALLLAGCGVKGPPLPPPSAPAQLEHVAHPDGGRP